MFGQTFAKIWPRRNALNTHLTHIPLDTFAVDRAAFLGQDACDLARTIEGMRGIQLINAVLERHFLRRWRNGLIVQTAATDPKQFGLGAECKRLGLVLDHRSPLIVTQDGNFFFRKFTWVVKRPISA